MRDDLKSVPVISAVLPFFNEEGNVRPLLSELESVLSGTGSAFEIICVDDCSTDRTWEELGSWAAGRPFVTCLRHRTRLGQSAAIASGFRAAAGDVVATLDGDGQNAPASIPAMLALLEPGVAAVCGVRSKRNDPAIKRVSSSVARIFRNLVTGDISADAGCGLRVIRRAALAEVPVFNGMHRFLPALLRFQGMRVVETPVAHRPRKMGISKYGIANRALRGIRDCAAVRWYRRRCLPADRVEERNR